MYNVYPGWDGLSANNNPDIVDKERWLYDWQQVVLYLYSFSEAETIRVLSNQLTFNDFFNDLKWPLVIWKLLLHP